jgi:glycogen(starch) synthase
MVHDWSTVRHRLFTYEHASFITPLLREDVEARQLYGATVTRSRRVFCVNPTMVNELQEIYPPDAEKFQYFPNAVDFDRFPFRVRQPPLRKWLYIGNLKPAKGSRRLVEGFRLALERWGDITLTLVGSGADVGWVRDQGLGRSLRHLPPIPASEVPAVMSEADLLVHLSDGETFGLTAIEAVASGMPVLVTSTDGSELVIRPLEHDVGTILPQTMTPSDVADAYGELRDAPARLDLASARRSLESSFAPSQVTDLLARCLSATDLVHS